MANVNCSIEATAETTLHVDPKPIHARFSWLVPAAESDANAIFASHVMTITRGVKVISSVLRNYAVDAGAISSGAHGTRPLMSNNDVEALAGLAESSLYTLYELAEARIDSLNDQASKGAKA